MAETAGQGKLVVRYMAAVDSSTLLDRSQVFESQPFTVRLMRNDDGVLDAIWVEKRMPMPDKVVPPILVSEGKPPARSRFDRSDLEILRDEDAFTGCGGELTGLLQYLESMAGYALGVHRIYWDDCIQEWFPETDDGQQGEIIFRWDVHRVKEPHPVNFDASLFGTLFGGRQHYDYLTVPFSFMREGVAEFGSRRFINAYFSCYFFLEGLYGKRKTKNRDVGEALKSSEHVETAVKEAMGRIEGSSNETRLLDLRYFLKRKNKEYTVDGLTDLIVGLRGDLHHFQMGGSGLSGHPLNQDDFEAPAYFLMCVCVGCCTRLLTGQEPA